MTTSGTPPRPTRKQLALLRSLAHQSGTTFTYPRTRRQASGQITELLKRPISEQLEFELDRSAIRGGEPVDQAA